ncbi:MAG: hypothetical protein PHU25_18120 [Deltaproteobacteria bacterium]|nr:hypothetical protein [Deltaproteobacteria bacterium]
MACKTILSVAIFCLAASVFVANQRTIGSGDTLPARYLPFSILKHGDFDLDEFPQLYDAKAKETYPTLENAPYYLRVHKGHYYSAYTIGPAIAALPVYVLPVLAGCAPTPQNSERLEKGAAVFIAALSALFLFLALVRRVHPAWAFALAATYALGTATLPVSGQALWQHGPSQMFLALMLLLLTRAERDDRYAPWAALALSAAIVMRSTDLVMALPFGVYLAVRHRGRLLRSLAFFAPPLALLAAYDIAVFGSLAATFEHLHMGVLAGFRQIPLSEGLFGTLLSPSRGLFVFSPVLLLAVPGALIAVRERDSLVLAAAVGAVLAILVAAKWFVWWGGHCYGPRLLADVLPLLVFCMHPFVRLGRCFLFRAVLLAFLALASTGVQILGAFKYDGRSDSFAGTDLAYEPLLDPGNSPVAFYAKEMITGSRIVPERRQAPFPASGDALTALTIVRPDRPQVALAAATARGSGRATLGLAVFLQNPYRPRAMNGYLLLRGPDGTSWSFDGRAFFPAGPGPLVSWVSKSPLPYEAEATFSFDLSGWRPGRYTWTFVLTDATATHLEAKTEAAFTVPGASPKRVDLRPSRLDPFGMAARCPWYDPDRLAMQWTVYLVTDDGRLIYVGFAGRLFADDGKPFSGVNAVVQRDNVKVVDAWQRLPADALRLRAVDADLTIGESRLHKEPGDPAAYLGHVEVLADGAPWVLDFRMEQLVGSCRRGGFTLLSSLATGNHFEYEVPCPKARMTGTIVIGGRSETISGLGYVETIRWLKSGMERPATWRWGYAHAGDDTVLFFKPDYPLARSLLLVSRGPSCVLADDDAALDLSEGDGRVVVRHGGDGLALSLSVDTTVQRQGGFPIFLAPYDLTLTEHGQTRNASGRMVFETGEWRSF